ncbi:hypothetical protein IQ278_11990 [Tolypothrix sp. LEGE 11397]|uniref:hypothetical protein n=1 Tax=Tolypothrix sp. LEGE 11397 TaxID=2777971 RepID=UPI0018813B02|nr:hypothetical protein [Tolypothrix sp. LEGE 11397]MBE9082834.1 hypothetical protein [Tolypothrix sp. LEGE 11397]
MENRIDNIIPVILFAYRRPDVVSQVLEAFRNDSIPLLIVFCDGAKGDKDASEVEEVRHLIRSIDWCETVVVEKDSNSGLGVSIKSGVSEVLTDYEAAIIFEDDLVCVPGTYSYLCAALNRYKNDPRVMSVTAWTHPAIIPSNVGISPYFDGKAECWAWGTWARAWKGMDRPALDIMNDCCERGIDIEKYGTDMPKMAAEAVPRNLWAIGWWYHHMLYNGLCLRPSSSMVEHICWDNRSTTSTATMMKWMNPPLQNPPPIPLDWPVPLEHPDCAQLWRVAIDGELTQ